MYKLILLTIILTLQSFSSYGKLKIKYLFCEPIKYSFDAFADGNYLKGKLSKWDKIEKTIGINLAKNKLTEYSIYEEKDEFSIEDKSFDFGTNDKDIYWTNDYYELGDETTEIKQRLNRKDLLLKQTLEVYNFIKKKYDYKDITIFQCDIVSRPTLFFKLKQKVKELEELRKEIRKNNKI